MAPVGKSLILLGILIAAVGLAVWGLSSVPYVGRLPGDFYLRRGNFTLYFPLTTCILISIALSAIFALMRRW
ncbi:MAG TPA: DUF2905 domain-containing protein [Candidatus Binataceae bacterium]|nr:DUF2905 domain-containing protein [Candidatus Binataceae bacterium]